MRRPRAYRPTRCAHAAYHRRAWIALGYESWAAMCDGENLRLPREVTAELRAGGLSIRAIASVTGISKTQVSDDLATVRNPQGNRTVAPPTQGLDGRSYRPLRFPEPELPTSRPAPQPKPAPTMLTLRTHTGEAVDYPKPASKATFNETTGDGISSKG